MRASGEYMGAVAGKAIAPILLVRVLNMPTLADPAVKVSAYFTDAEESISFFDEAGGAEVYLPVGMEFGPLSTENSSEVKSLNVKMDNVSREFCTLVAQVELSGVEVHFLRATRDELSSPECAQVIIVGRINAWTVTESQIEAEIIVPLSMEQKVPRRLYWPLCNWEFGGSGCGYWSAPSSTNLASAANAISGGDNGTNVKGNAFDGQALGWSPYWESSQVDTGIGGVAYIGQSGITEQVRRIRLTGYGVNHWPDSMKVQYSLDGSSWTDIATFDTSDYSGAGAYDIMLPDYDMDETHYIRVLANVDLASTYRFRVIEMVVNGVNSGPLPSGGCARTLTACKAYGAQEGFGGFPHLLKSRDPRNVWTKS